MIIAVFHIIICGKSVLIFGKDINSLITAMATPVSDISRLICAPDTLRIILKNTHFEQLTDIKLIPVVFSGVPVLAFKFPKPSDDFVETISYFDLKDAEKGWLYDDKIKVILELADPVIADQVSKREFFLSRTESEEFRLAFETQRISTAERIKIIENYIFANLSQFL